MSDDSAKIAKASEIHVRHRIGEVAGKLLNDSFRYASTPIVEFETRANRSYLAETDKARLLRCRGHELVVTVGPFRASYAHDVDSYYGDGCIYFDGALVLKVAINKEIGAYGSTIEFHTYPFSLKSMNAGDWLVMLPECVDVLDADAKRRTADEKAAKGREQASDIDLGAYEVCRLTNTCSAPGSLKCLAAGE
jgi:hypothetical protein